MASSPGRLRAADVTGRLRARFGQDLLETSEALDQATVRITRERYRELIGTLRDDEDFDCDFYDFTTAVDVGDGGFDVVTQLWSTSRRHAVRVKVAAGREEPSVPSISDLYGGANWHERETWELFGIDFEGHPQLVKLVLPEQFEGHPMRKDFPLATRLAKPWPGAEEGAEEEEEP
ncbi:MAG TPA: NADH-quinone oxidoreductase subunit C [Actinomycetota bacterium]|nr:NADH-quinone oxidoreductase subunit C [Actinomycetota bacterium]